MNPVEFLEAWFREQSNGEWEHTRGVIIETLKDPGWRVTIDLIETKLADRPLTPVRQERSPRDWLQYKVEHKQFVGEGDAGKLYAILQIFQDWARMETNQAELSPSRIAFSTNE